MLNVAAKAPAWLGLAVVPPTGPAYSLVLVAHVAAAVVGFGSIGLTGWSAHRAEAGPAAPDAWRVRRFFRSSFNVPSRAIYLVPVLGVTLLALSRGTFDVADPFVVIGLSVWVLTVVLAEGVVWPAERRLARCVSRWSTAPAPTAPTAPTAPAAPAAPADQAAEDSFSSDCRRVQAGAAAVVVLFVTAAVVMVVKP